MLNGRADATINDSLSFLDFKKHKPDADVKIAAEQADADYSGIIIRKGEPELLAAINKALAEIKADGTYQKIAEKYFGAGRLAVDHQRAAMAAGSPRFRQDRSMIRSGRSRRIMSKEEAPVPALAPTDAGFAPARCCGPG